MLIKNSCQSCGEHLEFEAEDAGATIACPHCGEPTALRLPRRIAAAAKLPMTRTTKIGYILLAVIVIVLAGIVIWATHANIIKAENYLEVIGDCLIGIGAVVVGILALYLTISWLILPWTLDRRLKDILAALNRLETHKRETN